MSTRTASAAQGSVIPKGLRVGLVAVTSVYSVAAPSLSIGDVIQMVKIPANSGVVFIQYGSTYVDCTWTVGDGLDNARYKAIGTLTAAQGMEIGKIVAPRYIYSQDDTIDIFVSLVSISTLIGGFNVTAIYSMDMITG
jgi:hypothetical protein